LLDLVGAVIILLIEFPTVLVDCLAFDGVPILVPEFMLFGGVLYCLVLVFLLFGELKVFGLLYFKTGF
jgi:hypothetical protein